jgi:hypothetical protein
MTMGSASIQPFTAVCGDRRVSVSPDAEIGPYVIHQDIRGFAPRGPAWVVSHRATGLVVWRTAGFDGAIKAARWLDEARTIPEGAAETIAWRAALTPEERGRLILNLNAVSPRWVSVE